MPTGKLRHAFRAGDRVKVLDVHGNFTFMDKYVDRVGTVVWQNKRPGHFDHAIVLFDKESRFSFDQSHREWVPSYLWTDKLRRRLGIVCVYRLKYLGWRVNPAKLR